MNRKPKLPRRQQQQFIRDEAVRLLHFASHACPCNGVGCDQCEGKMKYFDEPVPVYGIMTNAANTSKKEPEFPKIESGTFNLLVEPRFRLAKGDRLIPFGVREFEQVDEVLPVDNPILTYIPTNPRGVTISFQGGIRFRPDRDFTIAREMYGRVPLFSKRVKWLAGTPNRQTMFSARYGCLPEFEVEEIPPARLSQGQLLMQQVSLRKLTVAGHEKAQSYEPSADAVIGMKYE